MSTVDPREIAVLTTEVRHLTEAIGRLIKDMEKHRIILEGKGSAEDVQRIREDSLLLAERILVLQEKQGDSYSRMTSLESKMKKLEMQTWKLGLLLGTSATGGGLLSIIFQQLF